MKNSKALKALLLISGLIGAGIGGTILFMPAAFYAASGIELGGNISLLNEIRASGGTLLASGLLIMSGTFVVTLTFISTLVAALLYLSYGLSRLMSMAIDGMPDAGLTAAAALEIVIGLVCVLALIKLRANE